MKALFRLSLGLTLLTPISGICNGGENTDGKSTTVSSQLANTLKIEAEGKGVDRSQLLRAEIENTSGNDLANKALHWQAGEIEINGEWKRLSDLDSTQLSKEMQQYLAERGEAALDIDGHRRMAKWCQSHQLPDQQNAHWLGVLELDPNDLEARQALKFTQIDGRWFSPDEIALTQSNVKEQIKSLKVWLPKVRDMVAAMESDDSAKRLKAIQQLKGFKDPRAITSLQFVAERTEAHTALHLVNAIQRFRTKEACLALASLAVTNPTTELGQEAAASLRKYPKEMYVPDLLDFMSTEKDLRRQLVTQANGALVLQLLQVRELRTHVHTAQLDNVLTANNAGALAFGSVARFVGRTGGINSDFVVGAKENQTAANVTRNQAQRDAESQQAEINRENEMTRQTQRNVCTVLRTATGEKFDDSPTQWWSWWDLEQEILTVGNKEILQNYDRDFQSLVYSVDPTASRVFRATGSTENASAIQATGPTGTVGPRRLIRPRMARVNPGYRVDCLTAGSLVQTETGLRPIESVQVGDNVVSQHIETGEISLQPVVRTSQRPISITCSIVFVNDEKVQSTLGHNWWVTGKGWIKTKDLQSAMQIRTASGSLEIAKLEDAPEAVTYNIAVANNHSYFVGKDRLLSYDARELIPTLQVVPGVPASPLFQE